MNERLKELAEQAGGVWSEDWGCFMSGTLNLTRFADLVRQDEAAGMRETYMKMIHGAIADEREACAAVVEGRLSLGLSFEGCAATIRARGDTRTKTSRDLCGND